MIYAITTESTPLTHAGWYRVAREGVVNEVTMQEAREAARKRLEAKLGLAAHWVVYLAVNIGLVVAAGGFEGSWWRIAGWGLGLALHTGYVFVEPGGVKERLLERELAREMGQR